MKVEYREYYSMNGRFSLADFICKAGDTLVEAMKKIDSNNKGIVYVIDGDYHLTGSLSDGDIRRWILRTGSLDETALKACCRGVKYLYESSKDDAIEFMKKNEISSVPVIDEAHRILEIIFIDNEMHLRKSEKDREALSLPVIVMAGGKGTRLYPFTKILPKPLIPIGEIPILERILNKFYDYGVREFYLTVNYKKEMIKSYFIEMNPPYVIEYIEEEKPLGTAGSIRLIRKRFSSPVIVTNCDILIEEDYTKILRYHLASHNDMTIISSLKKISVPYGVLETKEHGIIVSMHEKPQLTYMVNTGMYVVNPEFLDWIPESRFFHMTDLADKMIKKGCQVGMYPISENSFLDMGEFEEMKKMEDKINSGYMN